MQLEFQAVNNLSRSGKEVRVALIAAAAGDVERGVLAGARMPAALFEVSFISNPVEERRLDSADYRQKIADSIVNAVRAYREGL